MTDTVWDAILDAERGETERVAALAAQLVDQIGWDTVRAHLTGVRVTPPAPGHAVLACACGAVLDSLDMHREPKRWGDGRAVRPIVCTACANRAW